MPGSTAGRGLSGSAGGGSAFRIPGRKNEAGEMLLEAVNPPQPVRKKRRTGRLVSRRILQFNLTKADYSLPRAFSNL